MTFCVLCTSEGLSGENSHHVDEEIVESYKIRDSIREHFECYDLILTNILSSLICSQCFITLKSFKLLQITVLTSNIPKNPHPPSKDLSNDTELTLEIGQHEEESYEIIDEEYLEEEISQIPPSPRRRHPANDTEGEQKIRDFIDISCHVCGDAFDSFFTLCRHFKALHPSQRAQLTCCGKTFTQRSILLEHLEYHDKSRVHRCEVCDKDFKTSAIHKAHMRNFHGNDSKQQLKCSECSKTFINKYTLKTHMRKHLVDDTRTFECHICKRPAKNFELLRDHLRSKHGSGNKTFVCHICSKVVTRLDIHLRQVHSSEPIERVKCAICGHWLKKASMKGHMAGHGESGFSCEICGKALKNRNSLFCHMKRVHTEGRFKCEFCEKSFHSEGRLSDHVACQHTGDFLHSCRVEGCEKMFRNAGRRRMHERRMHPAEYEKSLKPLYLRDHGVGS